MAELLEDEAGVLQGKNRTPDDPLSRYALRGPEILKGGDGLQFSAAGGSE